MKSGLQFLLAARRSEITELERLSRSSALVGAVGALTHAVQRERGITNVFLASGGERFGPLRLEQIAQTDGLRQPVLDAFEALDSGPDHHPNGARLFNRIAGVMHELDGLAALRAQVAQQRMTPRAATEAYSRLVGGLLAVVFEAADSAGDPAIARALVALFNFMQGKEFAGQERAHGAAVFASLHIDAPQVARWRHLVELQQQAFDVFRDFADPALASVAQGQQPPGNDAEVERLRHVGWTLGQLAMDEGLASRWYDAMTARIDAMRATEELLASHLRSLCAHKIEEARALLQDEAALLAGSAAAPGAGDLPARLAPQLERSVLALVQEQSQRLQAMGEELEAVRATLNERKLIERAKGVLMAHRQLSEEDAYKLMRQMAMNQKRRIGDVAEALLSMAEVLPGKPR
ncbi:MULTISPECIES: nitrate regulatory protein [Ramlibacter]|uniref:Nitrate- and nitrite sensing domain-containing protein n=1 Tax=Ramlibacter aquaticus TaxID=2780094 RepID=A0ABR9S9E2_9BURK|nr:MULTISPECIES: nitrate regulatory protein [Ramlibacter]MBE7938951.1 nitrate- and nitrite sensing domain-containing protein [Ramlibacter aquaticus]